MIYKMELVPWNKTIRRLSPILWKARELSPIFSEASELSPKYWNFSNSRWSRCPPSLIEFLLCHQLLMRNNVFSCASPSPLSSRISFTASFALWQLLSRSFTPSRPTILNTTMLYHFVGCCCQVKTQKYCSYNAFQQLQRWQEANRTVPDPAFCYTQFEALIWHLTGGYFFLFTEVNPAFIEQQDAELWEYQIITWEQKKSRALHQLNLT
jgi:hypothetical protein